jgi:Protein of unknown function (DUF1524)
MLHKLARSSTFDSDVGTDNDFFRKYVQEAGGIAKLEQRDQKKEYPEIPSQRRVMDNFLSLRKMLAEQHAEQPDRLKKIIYRFLENTYFVVAKTGNVQNAIRIFTVVNNRGMDLTPRDIVKADVFDGIPQEHHADYAYKWEEIEDFLRVQENARGGGLHELLEHIASTSGSAIATESKQAQLSTIIRMQYRDDPKNWGIKFIDDVLYPHVRAFQVVKAANLSPASEAPENKKHTDDCNGQLKHLSRLCDSNDWVPVAMKLVLRWGNRPSSGEAHDHKKLAVLLRLLEVRAFAFTVLYAQARKRQVLYSSLLQLLNNPASDTFEKVSSTLRLSPQEKQRVVSRLDVPDFYQKTRFSQYVLLRLDETYSHASLIYERLPEIISIEHVLPQRPRKAWLSAFPKSEDRDELTNCLGNLVLLPLAQNIDASNLPFREKFEKYFCPNGKRSNPFAITTSLVRYREWTPKIVLERKKELLERCKRIWDLS